MMALHRSPEKIGYCKVVAQRFYFHFCFYFKIFALITEVGNESMLHAMCGFEKLKIQF